MNDVAKWYLRAAPCWALAGMVLGLVMAASEDHAQHPTHAHINLLGWVTLALFGLYLKAHPVAAAMRQARWLFWLHNAALAIMAPALWLLYRGVPAADPFAALSGFMLLGAMALFAWIVFASTRD
jgi:hypothetical protein